MDQAPLLSRGPDVASIEALHRHDGYISFASKSSDDWRPAIAMRASELQSIFPQFREQLLKDSFVSMNASWCLAYKGTKKPYGLPAHRTENLRYLCACYCDIDFYKKGLSYDEVLGVVKDLSESGQLPWPSSIVNSGRGMWLLWFLHDEDHPTKAHLGAYSDNSNNHLQLYAKINRAIGQRLSDFGADPAATDAARYLRVPGSFRMDTEEYVEWSLPQENGCTPTYTLKTLADFLGIRVRPRLPQEASALAEPRLKVGKRSTGYRAANRNKLAAFITLKDLRAGGFAEGCRNYAALIYAACLKWNGVSRGHASVELAAMAEQCTPTLSSGECASAVKSAYKKSMKKMSYQWIANVLRVYPEEAAVISGVIGKPFPSASAFGGVVAFVAVSTGENREMKRALRRLEIQRIVEAIGRVPPGRAMQSELIALGIEVGHVTVMTDYKALGMNSSACIGVARRRSMSIPGDHSIDPLLVQVGGNSRAVSEEDGDLTLLYAKETEQTI